MKSGFNSTHFFQAGLFSATITAFTIESHKWLNEDPTVRLLAQLSQHLGTPNVSANNSTIFTIPPEAVRINIVWFLSLIIALSAALIGILCKQWIREYQRDAPISNEEAFELRQLRHQSWEAWHVPDIISSTSILLQLALLLFFAGIVDLLWSRVHVTIIAAIVSVAVGISVLFILITIILPFVHDLIRVVLPDRYIVERNNLIPCAYRSPLSRVFVSFSHSLTHRRWLNNNLKHIDGSDSEHFLREDKFRDTSDWLSIDLHLLRHFKRMADTESDAYLDRMFKWDASTNSYLHRGMKWAASTMGDDVVTMKHLFHCMESSSSADINTLVPYALGYPWQRDSSRHSAYLWYLNLRGYARDLPYFYIEALLHAVEDRTILDVLTISSVIREVHPNDHAMLPQG